MSERTHLLIAFAAGSAPGFRPDVAGLALPTLASLLARMEVAATDLGEAHDLSLPHERVLARAEGIWRGDGRVSAAAWDLRSEGGDPGEAAWAWLTPCHWTVGRDHIRMQPPEALQLQQDESLALLEAMAPYFRDDGIEARALAPTRWLARGEAFRELACASLDRVTGRVVDDWLPRAAEARTMRRLQQEMQMLLYTHPVNEAREARGMLPVNSFWVSGAGALAADSAPPSALPQLDDSLRAPALAGDAAAWAQAWRRIDAEVLPPLRAALERGEDLRLTLCGEAGARTWGAAPGGIWRRLSRIFRPVPLAQAFEDL